MKKIIALLLALVMVLALFVGCASEGAAPAESDTVVVPSDKTDDKQEEKPAAEDEKEEDEAPAEEAETETPIVFNWTQGIGIDTYFESPHKDTQSWMTTLIFQQMQENDATTGEWVEMIGKDWTMSDDMTQFSITLVDGWTWHDGTPVTVDDVVFSLYDSAMNVENSYGGNFTKVVGIDAFKEGKADTIEGITVDGNTVTVTLSEPNGLWDYLRGMYLIPKHLLGHLDWNAINMDAYWEKPVGCGRMYITEVSLPDYFLATRYDAWNGGEDVVGFKNAKFLGYSMGATSAAVTALMSGELDFATRQIIGDGDTAAAVKATNPDIVTFGMAATSHRIFSCNLDNDRQDGVDNSYMADKRVRKAFDLLIDQDKITALYPGAAIPTKTQVPSTSAEYHADLVKDYPAYDPDQAKALLEEAGFDFETEVTLVYYYDTQLDHDVMELIKQDFAAAGVKLNPWCVADNATEGLGSNNWEMMYSAAGTSANFQSTICQLLTSSGSYVNMMLDGNGKGWEETDPLYAGYCAARSTEERIEWSHKLQEWNFENVWQIPCYYQAFFSAYNPTKISLPEEYFVSYSTSFMNWSEWKVLG